MTVKVSVYSPGASCNESLIDVDDGVRFGALRKSLAAVMLATERGPSDGEQIVIYFNNRLIGVDMDGRTVKSMIDQNREGRVTLIAPPFLGQKAEGPQRMDDLVDVFKANLIINQESEVRGCSPQDPVHSHISKSSPVGRSLFHIPLTCRLSFIAQYTGLWNHRFYR